MNKEDICFMSAWDMREKIASQELTSLEITETLIERIEKINPLVNAYCTTTFDLARDMAKKADDSVKKGEKLGILHGIPTSIKDIAQVKGVRTTFGSKVFENFISDVDEPSVKKLKDAGIVLLGKTNTPEDAHLSITDNQVFGVTRNPWNLERCVGGSSGGAASAVAAGISPLALGTDGGGSIRVPSCLCGIYGFKPNWGRVARGPTHAGGGTPVCCTLSTFGPMTRYVKDAALMLEAMAGPNFIDKHSLIPKDTNYIDAMKEERPNKLKIGYAFDYGYVKVLDKKVEEDFLKVFQKFEKFDWTVEEVKFRFKNAGVVLGTIISTATARSFKPLLNEWKDKLSPTLVKRVEMGMGISGIDLIRVESDREKISIKLSNHFKDYDILLTPTSTIPAWEADVPEKVIKINGKTTSTTFSGYGFVWPFNMGWNPATTIPCGWFSDGLPMGMQIGGRKLDEKTVLQVSQAFEEIYPFHEKRPQF